MPVTDTLRTGSRKVTLDSFRCTGCGNCCRVPGYVLLGPGEAERMADHLGMDVYAFTERHTRLVPTRQGLSLADKPDGSCVFLGDDNRCGVYPVRPEQCRGFPVAWRFEGFEDVCEGMNPVTDGQRELPDRGRAGETGENHHEK